MSTAAEAQTKKRTVKVPRIQYRNFEVEVEARADGGEDKVRFYPLSFSSEAPVRRFSWDTWEEYDEILSHAPGDVDLSRAQDGLPLIKSHQRLLHFGSVNEIALDEKRKRLHGMASFSSIPLGQEQETMLREGHIKTVSVGYEVLSMELASKDNKTGIATYRCMWMPFEVSTEPIPADHEVGFGRTRAEARAAGDVDLVEFTIEEPAPSGRTVIEGERSMSVEEKAPTKGAENPAAPVVVQSAAAPVETRDRGVEAAEITEMAQHFNFGPRAAGWIREGRTPDQVRREIMDLIRTHGAGQPAAEALDGVPARDVARYSIQRAIQMQVERHEGRRSAYDGLEAEVHQEMMRKRGVNAEDHGGVLVPWRLSDRGQRTLGTTEPTGGATLVGQMVMPDLIDVLRNRALCLVAGARLYPGLQGNVIFNRATGDPIVYWMDENPPSDVTPGEPGYGYVTMSPKTVIGQVQIPRQLVVQATFDMEFDIRTRLGSAHALKMDLGALHGNGTDKQPAGIYSQAGVLSHAVGGVPDVTDLTTMAGLVADKNADIGALAYMTTPLEAAVLMRTPVITGFPPFIWQGSFRQGQILGFSAFATNQISKTLGDGGNEHGLIYGNWNDLAFGIWGNEIEIVVDVVTKAGKGQIVITSYSMFDSAALRTDSFCKGTGATIA